MAPATKVALPTMIEVAVAVPTVRAVGEAEEPSTTNVAPFTDPRLTPIRDKVPSELMVRPARVGVEVPLPLDEPLPPPELLELVQTLLTHV